MQVKDKTDLIAAIGLYLFSEFMKPENGHLTGQQVLDNFKSELTLDNLHEHRELMQQEVQDADNSR